MDSEPLYYTNENQEKVFLLENGKKVIGNFDETLLQNISQLTGGQYFSADNVSKLQTVFSEIESMTHPKTTYLYEEKKVSLTPSILIGIIITFVIILIFERYFRNRYRIQ